MNQYSLSRTDDHKVFYQRPYFWWKIYLWILALIFIPLIITSLFHIREWALIDYFYLFSINLTLCALFSYSYQDNLQNLFSSGEWKALFVIGILFLNLDMVYTIAPFAPDLNNLMSSSYFYSRQQGLPIQDPLTRDLINAIYQAFPYLIVGPLFQLIVFVKIPLFYALFRLGWRGNDYYMHERRVLGIKPT